MRDSYLPFCKPSIGQEEISEVIAVLQSGWLTTGPRVTEFETALAEYLDAKHVVALNSCTAGLHLALLAADIGPGDEVITTPYTFVSTAHVILQVGAKPIFADVYPDTFDISVDEVARKIGPRTKAIMPVHFAGQPCDMNRLRTLAQQHNLFVIEDAAHAIGAECEGQKIGHQGTAVFSFYATKNLTTGEGGALATDDTELTEKVRRLSLHGMNRDAWRRYSDKGSWFYEVTELGYKYNMTDLQAALGLCQLRKLDDFIKQRGEICKRYDEAFDNVNGLTILHTKLNVRHARHLYPLLVNYNRNEFIECLRIHNIGASVHFIPVHLHPYYQTLGYKRGDFPVSEYVYDREVSLPLYPGMTGNDVQDVIEAVLKCVDYVVLECEDYCRPT